MIRQAKVLIGYRCNNHCLFCYDKRYRDLPVKTTIDLEKEILAAKRKGYAKIHFIGGEPTMRQDIICLIQYARRIGFKDVMITTNGRMLAYWNFAHQIIQAGVTQIVISVHGHIPKIHDVITNVSGGFRQLEKGIENLKKIGFKNIGTNTTIAKLNYTALFEIAKLLYKWQIQRAEFIYVCAMPDEFKDMTPLVSQVMPYLKKMFSFIAQKGLAWRVLNLPIPCPFEEYFKYIYSGIETKAPLFVKSRAARLYQEVNDRKKLIYVKRRQCKKCPEALNCKGVSKEYINQYGDKEMFELARGRGYNKKL